MMLVLVAGYPVCVNGGTSFVMMYQVMAVFVMLRKPSCMVVKDECRAEAEVVFDGMDVKLTSERQLYLGSAIESTLYIG